MDAREFDFVDPEEVKLVNAEAIQRSINPMESAFHAGWREWFESLKTCIVVKRP